MPEESKPIYIDAISRRLQDEAYDRIKSIIEVKGPWNDELQSAMETQLVGRYMKDSDCRHGLYLVGWFNCEQWDEDDWRRKRIPAWDLEEAREYFEKQARELRDRVMMMRSFVINASLR